MRIAISGPGRSGSSLLVKLFGLWGFSHSAGEWFGDAQAGLESRLGSKAGIEIDKDPWAFEYIAKVDLTIYDHFIIPIRQRDAVTSSRSVQERYSQILNFTDDRWKWRTGGWVAGGAVYDVTKAAISECLSEGLWDLLHHLSSQSVRPIFVEFPRFAKDFEYLWECVGHIAETRISKTDAKSQWESAVDIGRLRVGNEREIPSSNLGIEELEALVEMLRKKTMALSLERDTALTERDTALTERDTALTERDTALTRVNRIMNTKSWRWTATFRRLSKGGQKAGSSG